MCATASGRDIGQVRLAAARTLARFASRTAKRDEAERAPGEACGHASALCHTTINPSVPND